MTKRFFAILLALLLAGAPALAQQRYEPWRDPNARAADTSTQKLIEELNKLVDEAERSRAANPVFLRDLRDLARRYADQWPRVVLSDTFADGNFTADPAWTVTEGEFRIEPNFGLRGSFAEAAAQSSGSARDQRREAARQIFGAILGQTLGTNQGGGTTASAERRAAIHTAVPISNAFSIEMELTSWRAETGTLALGPYQGADLGAGYRLIYRSGARPSLELQRYGRRGAQTIGESATPVVLEDKQSHVLKWTRDAVGQMTVSVDGNVKLKASDRGFRDAFDGLSLVNAEGDYILRRIEVRGGS